MIAKKGQILSCVCPVDPHIPNPCLPSAKSTNPHWLNCLHSTSRFFFSSLTTSCEQTHFGLQAEKFFRFQPVVDPVSVVCIADTHNSQSVLPRGDVLVHAGDLTQSGSLKELQSTLAWLSAQPRSVKVVIAGNHDLLLDASRDDKDDGSGQTAAARREMLDWGDIISLENAETAAVCVNGRHLRIYGSPFSPCHGNWTFQYPRSKDVWEGGNSPRRHRHPGYTWPTTRAPRLVSAGLPLSTLRDLARPSTASHLWARS